MGILMMLMIISSTIDHEDTKNIITMFWNLENFYDWKDQGTCDSDYDFSSMGPKHWTYRKFCRKCESVSKTIFMVAEKEGKMPDVIGFAEVENKDVLYRLISNTLLRKCDYQIVHFDSGDKRGIDVALLYRETIFDLISTSLKVPHLDGNKIKTRDMLHVALKHKYSDKEYDFIVCHHPSKYGGEEISGPKRSAAINALKETCDSLKGCNLIIMGDFNDVPEAPQFEILSDTVVCMADTLHMQHEGTIRYKGNWELIDMFFISDVLKDISRMKIIDYPFLLRKESSHSGFKPFRTYVGPRYIGGVSDHLPIVLKMDFSKNH